MTHDSKTRPGPELSAPCKIHCSSGLEKRLNSQHNDWLLCPAKVSLVSIRIFDINLSHTFQLLLLLLTKKEGGSSGYNYRFGKKILNAFIFCVSNFWHVFILQFFLFPFKVLTIPELGSSYSTVHPIH